MELSLRVKGRSRRLGLGGNRTMSLAVRIPKLLNRNYLLGNMEILLVTMQGMSVVTQ